MFTTYFGQDRVNIYEIGLGYENQRTVIKKDYVEVLYQLVEKSFEEIVKIINHNILQPSIMCYRIKLTWDPLHNLSCNLIETLG